MRHKRLILLGCLLVSTLACVIPGLEASAPGPVDPNKLPTVIVMTANAAASQTAVAGALATKKPAANDPTGAGATVEQLQDGTTKYSDFNGGFEVIFPVGWLAVRPNSDEFNTYLATNGADNTMLRDQMTADQAGFDPNVDRLYAYILRPDLGENTIFGYSKLVWDADDTTPIDNATMGELLRSLESAEGIPGFRASTAQVRGNDHAVNLIEIGGHYTISDGQGGAIPFYVTIIFFKPTPDSLTRMTFTFLQDYHAQISADVESIIASIKVGP